MTGRALTIKRIANVLLIVTIVKIAGLIAIFFQTRYQLVSPVIPKGIIADIAAPYLFNALITSVALIAALIFHFYSKHIISIIICACAILLPTTLYFLFFPI